MILKNAQYQAIMRMYDQIRARNRHEQDLRYEEIAEKIPAYAELETQINRLYAKRARAAVTGAGTDTEAMRRQISDYRSRQQALLTAAGYAPDYLELTYDCPDCRDTGFIGEEKCHCFKKAVVDLLYDQSGLKEILQKENFSHFREDYYDDQVDRVLGISPRENIRNVLAVCRRFIRNFDSEGGNLLFYGDTGVGKTFLTNCIAKEMLDTSHTVIDLTALRLVEILEDTTFGSDDDDAYSENMMDYILDCDLLIIDDLGTELNNTFVTSRLFYCINERLAGGRSTIISTNLSLQELQDAYTERIFSRIVSGFEILKILGDDIRIRRSIS